jgi:hypothetical protein
MKPAAIQTRSPMSILKTSEIRVKAFLVRYEALGRGEGLKKKRLLHRLRQNLDIQLELEKGFLYPAFGRLNQVAASRFVSGALENHEEIQTLLKELTELDVANRPLDLKMDALRRSVLRHLGLERFQIASLLRMLSGEILRDLSQEMGAARERLRSKQAPRGHPPLYPSLQTESRSPQGENSSSAFALPDEGEDGRPSEFENWGSE